MNCESICSRYTRLKGNRGNWEALWRDSANYILTRKNNIGTVTSQGENRDVQVFDTTACRANEKFAAGMFSYLCPPGETWFLLRSPRKELMQNEEVSNYFDEVGRIIREALYLSNFVLEMHEAFLDDGAFGTANIYMAEGTKTPLTFKCIHIDEYCIDENHEGFVDVVFRLFTMTLRQVVQKFGEDKLCANLKKLWDDPKSNNLDKPVQVLHAVFPREEMDSCKCDTPNMPFVSCYIDYDNKCCLSESGYREQPYLVFRFSKSSNEVWGRGPGTTMIPEVKLLNKIKKTCLVGAEKAVDPPLFIPDDGVVGQLRTTPGAINYWRANAYQNKPESWKFEGNLPIGLEMMNMEKVEIERGFFIDLFEQLAQRKQEMTATEVVERVREKLVMIAPAIGRTQNELLSPMISRAYRILGEMGVLPPIPSPLNSFPAYEVYYVSKLAMAIKALDIDAVTDTFATVMPMMQYDPTIVDSFNFDAISRGIAHRNGMPSDFLFSMEIVERKREERAKKEQAAQAMQVASTLGSAAGGLGKAIEPESPLSKLSEMLPPQEEEEG